MWEVHIKRIKIVGRGSETQLQVGDNYSYIFVYF